MRHLLLLALLLASGCDDPSSPEPVAAGWLVASLSGAVTDRYEAQGSEPVSAGSDPVTFASARSGADPELLVVGGFRARGADEQDMLMFVLEGVRGPGAHPVVDGSLNWGQTSTRSGRVFVFRSAEVVVDSVSDRSIGGRFQAVAVELVVPLTGVAPDTLYIRDGSFSVPILPNR